MLGGPAPVLAQQLRGRVLDQDSAAVSEALVELWDSGRRLAVSGTGPDGRFFFLQTRDPAGLALLVRRVGFLPLRRTLRAGERDVVLVLRSRPPVLEEVSVTAAASSRCVTRDDRVGRQLWRAVAARYAGGTHRLLHAEPRTMASLVRPESLGMVDTAGLVTGVLSSGGYFVEPRPREMIYGWPVRYLVGRFERWEHPWLESVDAGHFTDTLFASMNRFGSPLRVDQGFVLPFCSRRERNPESGEHWIVGTLNIGADSTMLSARWEFVTPPPEERVGGEVSFAPPARPATIPLPMAGLFWRRRNDGRYYQEWWEYRQWFLCAVGPEGCRVRTPVGGRDER